MLTAASVFLDFLFGEKGIKRDYSNPRTPQQNGVAERKNRTLIEAARTMLADSKLPTMFWTEAVSTACYVLNRVSITNPHNKTPYELISGKVPQISHLKPFGCQVTILNTSDYLGKFEGKADDGYLVGYASHSKAYRVYNLPNKRVEETLNLRFLEDKPNVQGIGHEWYFDLDYLTDSLGYTRFKTDTPAGTQETNINAGTQDHDSDSEVDEQVIVVPSFPSNRFAGPSSSNGPSIMERNADYAEELAKLQRQEYEAKDAAARYGYLFSQATAEILCQAEAEIRNQGVSAGRDPAGINSAVRDPAGIDSAVTDPAGIVSADGVSTGSPSAGNDPAGGNPADSFPPAGSVEPADESNPAVSSSVSADLNSVYADESTLPPGQQLGSSENTTRFPVPSDVCMDQPSSGIFTSSSYDDDFRATLTNLAPAVEVNPVPTKRVNTIHPQSQILGDLASPVLTRSRAHKSKFGESAFIGYIQDQQRTNHTDQLHCLSACFLSQLEPTSIAKALEDPDWVDAMQEEMQPDSSGIVVRNKARLVAQGHRQEEGIDYDELEVKSCHSSMEKLKKKCMHLPRLVMLMTSIFGQPIKTWCDDFGGVDVMVNLKLSAMGEEDLLLRSTGKQLPDGKYSSAQDKTTSYSTDFSSLKASRKNLSSYLKWATCKNRGFWYPKKDSPISVESYSDKCKKQTIVDTSSTESRLLKRLASCCAQVKAKGRQRCKQGSYSRFLPACIFLFCWTIVFAAGPLTMVLLVVIHSAVLLLCFCCYYPFLLEQLVSFRGCTMFSAGSYPFCWTIGYSWTHNGSCCRTIDHLELDFLFYQYILFIAAVLFCSGGNHVPAGLTVLLAGSNNFLLCSLDMAGFGRSPPQMPLDTSAALEAVGSSAAAHPALTLLRIPLLGNHTGGQPESQALGDLLLTLVTRVKKLERTVKQLRTARLVGDAPATAGDVDIHDEVDLEGLTRMASEAYVGHNQAACSHEIIEERQEEEDPLMLLLLKQHLTSAGPFVVFLIKERHLCPDLDIPAKFCLVRRCSSQETVSIRTTSERMVSEVTG
ncbi:ribonuclease H-like domain-containing protein [Tanacetum coccineum]